MAISSIASGLARMETKLMGGGGGNDGMRSAETGSIQEEQLIQLSRQEPTAMLVARLIARTLLIITIIVSAVVLLSVYLQSKQQCDTGLEFVPAPEALASSESSSSGFDEPMPPMRRLPISIRMMGPGAGDLMSGASGENRGRVNCLIERKTANQIIASEPKKLQTPFGNITTDPRLVHLTGEKLEFSCRSGDDAKDMQDEPEPKPVIIISRIRGLRGPTDSDNNNNDADDDGHPKPDEADSIDAASPTTTGKPVAGGTQLRRKRHAESLTKECSCHCGC